MRLMRVARIAVLMSLGVVLAASCSALTGLTETAEELQHAGYRGAKVHLSAGDDTSVRVTYRTDARDVAQLATEYREAAGIVWRTTPVYLDAVELRAEGAPTPCTGECSDRFDRSQLHARFGPRPEALDQDLDRQGLYLAVGLVVIALVLALAVTTLIVRSRRRAATIAHPTSGWPGAPPGWRPSPPVNDAPRPVAEPSPGYAPPTEEMSRPLPPPPPPPPPPPEPDFDIWARPPS